VHLTLLVPELIWPEPADQRAFGRLAAPGFGWLAARARRERQPRRAFETALAAACGFAAAPCAPLRLLGEGDEAARAGHWLCADPVHLRFHHDRIALADASAFDLADDEAGALVAALNEEFADLGEFRVADAKRWYLRLHVAVDHPAEPISAVAGRRVDGRPLPLTRRLNEIQMFLHGHPVNERRQAAGQPAVNSVWLWGGGALPATAAAPFSAVFADHPLAAGLAHHAGVPLHRRPDSLAALPDEAGERPLVVLDELLPRVACDDGDGWRAAFAQLDAGWLAPLQSRLGKQVDRVSLLAPTAYGELHYTLAGSDRWKFWKGSLPLAGIAGELAAGAPA
jgi:hypothetical protein